MMINREQIEQEILKSNTLRFYQYSEVRQIIQRKRKYIPVALIASHVRHCLREKTDDSEDIKVTKFISIIDTHMRSAYCARV